MEPKSYQHRIVLLVTGFQYPDRHLFFSRAKLFPDRIELSGWSPGEMHRAEIPLAQLRHIEWRPDVFNEANAVFHIEDGSEIPLVLKQIYLWEHTLEERLCWRTPAHRPTASRRQQNMKEMVAYVTSMS